MPTPKNDALGALSPNAFACIVGRTRRVRSAPAPFVTNPDPERLKRDQASRAAQLSVLASMRRNRPPDPDPEATDEQA